MIAARTTAERVRMACALQQPSAPGMAPGALFAGQPEDQSAQQLVLATWISFCVVWKIV
jgi:hypothetical protein